MLLVDDDPHVATTARRALERAGYVVVQASNGKDALRAVDEQRRPFDVLITDLVMPEMGGRELAKRRCMTSFTRSAPNRDDIVDCDAHRVAR